MVVAERVVHPRNGWPVKQKMSRQNSGIDDSEIRFVGSA
jgi:hypothetical protein